MNACPNCKDELTHYSGFTVGGESDERWDEDWYECEGCNEYFTEEELRRLEPNDR